MLYAYANENGCLRLLPQPADQGAAQAQSSARPGEGAGPGDELGAAIWIDLYRPDEAEIAAVRALGLNAPSLADMEEIEISNRLYHQQEADYMTVVLPGLSESKLQTSGPVCFVLTPERLVTVRHHTPRPFETYPTRADKVGPGCNEPRRLFLSLIEEIIGRLADLLENSGRDLDAIGLRVFRGKGSDRQLSASLRDVSRISDMVSKIRLSLLTLERAVSFAGQSLFDESGERSKDRRGTPMEGRTETTRPGTGERLRPVYDGLLRDIQALEEHGDFLSNRIAMTSDLTLGMISLAQNDTNKIVSILAVIFLPPTLIASAYGMNFTNMPELNAPWGYPAALALMLASAVGTFLIFKWKRWL